MHRIYKAGGEFYVGTSTHGCRRKQGSRSFEEHEEKIEIALQYGQPDFFS